MTTKKYTKYIKKQNKISNTNDINKKYNKCYKKYCNKIITKKQLTKKLIKQFDNFKKGKNTIIEKRKNLSLIIRSDKCRDTHCNK